MKKLIAVLLLLMMILPSAHADVELEFVFSYNLMAESFGLPKLPEPYGESVYYCEETGILLSVSASAFKMRSTPSATAMMVNLLPLLSLSSILSTILSIS